MHVFVKVDSLYSAAHDSVRRHGQRNVFGSKCSISVPLVLGVIPVPLVPLVLPVPPVILVNISLRISVSSPQSSSSTM